MKIRLPIIVLFVLLQVNCSGAPVVNIHSQQVPVRSKPYSIEQIEEAIQEAAVFLGWELKKIRPGRIKATLRIRSHVAQVLIDYSIQNYSIQYHDSNNLEYENGNIHASYNLWVEEFGDKIQKELSSNYL